VEGLERVKYDRFRRHGPTQACQTMATHLIEHLCLIISTGAGDLVLSHALGESLRRPCERVDVVRTSRFNLDC
jgi:hypothetical protein